MTERIAVLFVHGIGEQQPREHVEASGNHLAELLKRQPGVIKSSVAVHAESGGGPALTVQVETDGAAGEPSTRLIDCYEAYWADVAERGGLFDTLAFWTWGLGQWGAPIYRNGGYNPDEAQVDVPGRESWSVCQEIRTRTALGFYGLLAFFTLVTWSVAKRLFGAVARTAPGPSIIVQYLGDVETLQRRARPGMSPLTDPGFPHRVAIRRRVTGAMLRMNSGAEPYDRWFLFAHSLGTVLAYNAMTETGKALPNYLTEEEFHALPARLLKQAEAPFPIKHMMPARPPWLNDRTMIDREQLFANFGGFITYGSPLDKFAEIWPRIIATATEDAQTLAAKPWLNIHDPADPVGAPLDAFDWLANKREVPRVSNVAMPGGAPLVAHIRYLAPRLPWKERAKSIRDTLAQFILHPDYELSGIDPDGKPLETRASGCYAAHLVIRVGIALLLYILAATVVALLILPFEGAAAYAAKNGLASLSVPSVRLPAGIGEVSLAGVHGGLGAVLAFTLPLVAALATFFIGAAGLLRYIRDNALNQRAAEHTQVQDRGTEMVLRLSRRQKWAGGVLALIGTVLLVAAVCALWPCGLGMVAVGVGAVSIFTTFAALILAAILNKSSYGHGAQPGVQSPETS